MTSAPQGACNATTPLTSSEGSLLPGYHAGTWNPCHGSASTVESLGGGDAVPGWEPQSWAPSLAVTPWGEGSVVEASLWGVVAASVPTAAGCMLPVRGTGHPSWPPRPCLFILLN